MTNQFIENLNAVCDKLGITIDWTSNNLMPQIQDLLTRYGRGLLTDAITGLVAGVLLLVMSVFLVKRSVRTIRNVDVDDTWENNNDDLAIGIAVAMLIEAAIIAVMGLCFFLLNLGSVVKGIMVPDVYAVQKLLEMLQ